MSAQREPRSRSTGGFVGMGILMFAVLIGPGCGESEAIQGPSGSQDLSTIRDSIPPRDMPDESPKAGTSRRR